MNPRWLTVVIVWCVIAPTRLESDGQAQRVIEVTTVAQLYAAVENDANRNATLMVRAGTYLISRPLRLRPGMGLVGANAYEDVDRDGIWDRRPGGGWVVSGETILDARAMMVDSPVTRDCNAGGITTRNPEAAVLIGDGTHVRGVTIRAPPDGVGIGEASDARVAPTAEIEDSVIEGGRRGAVMGNRGCAARGFRSTLGFARNIVVGSGVGLTLANFVTDHDGVVAGPTIVATLRRNRFAGNDTGLAIQGGLQGTDGGIVEVISIENRFENNAAGGIAIRAGASQPTSPGASANGNAVRFFSTDDAFQANGAPAVLLVASDRLAMDGATGGENHGNRLVAHIVNARIEGASPGVLAIGGRYRGTDANEKSGTGNIVTVLVRAVTRPPVSMQIQADSPARGFSIDPPNRVDVIR